MRTHKIHSILLLVLTALSLTLSAQEKSLHQLQQEFVDLRLGMFVHFGSNNSEDYTIFLMIKSFLRRLTLLLRFSCSFRKTVL